MEVLAAATIHPNEIDHVGIVEDYKHLHGEHFSDHQDLIAADFVAGNRHITLVDVVSYDLSPVIAEDQVHVLWDSFPLLGVRL